MKDARPTDPVLDQEPLDRVPFHFTVSRRSFVQVLGAGLLIAVTADVARAQRAPGRPRGGGGGGGTIQARIHLGKDGTITVLTGKVEGGQGARTELTQVAAEELRLAPDSLILLMADTSQVPDDGLTAGSRTTPSTVPAVRQGAAAARELLLDWAATKWSADRSTLQVRDGAALHPPTDRKLSYADLAASEDAPALLEKTIPPQITLTPVAEWKVMGVPLPRRRGRDLVTGAHQFPSDITRPGMLYGKILRAPSHGARLTNIDTAPAKAIKDVVVVQDGPFVGVAAPTSHAARQALDALAATARWEQPSQPSSKKLYSHLKENARIPANPFADDVAKAPRRLAQEYHVAYVQHAPLEPRAAVAEWIDGSLTVWTGSQNPFGVHGELARAFRLPNDRVRVLIPDFGGGFGGKHTGEAAIEAARLAQAAGKPVCLRWTREEEFTWAYFRPAAVITAEAGLDAQGALTSWHFVNINSGSAGIDTPYRIARAKSVYVPFNAPLRQGSYRALAATANNFARECFMDELAAAAGKDPLDFRLAHLENPRIRAVLETAAARFDWANRIKKKEPNVGLGLACGTEKGSVVAACVEIAVDRAAGTFQVRKICEAFECGPIINPANLLAQVKGCIIMGLGAALFEEMEFQDGKILNASFFDYRVPRIADVPELDIHLVNRPDLPPVGAGETPIIAIAPAIANAVFHVTGLRTREMPIRLPR